MGWNIFDMTGTNSLNQNFGYNPAQSNVSGSNTYLSNAMGNMGTSAGQVTGAGQTLMGQSQQAWQQGQDRMDPSGAWAQQQRSMLSQGLQSGASQENRMRESAMAARGIGGGGLSSVLRGGTANAMGEQLRQGSIGIANQGFQQGQSLLGMGMQGASQAGGLYGQAAGIYGQQGGMAGDMQNRLMQQAMFNAGQQNEQQQYSRTSQYNQALGNRENAGGFFNNLLQVGGTVAAAKAPTMCIPEGTKIDTPEGRTKIEDLKTGDDVIGYDGEPVTLMQKHEYDENPEIKRFLRIYLKNGDTVNLCDMHRIDGKRSKEYNVGESINGKEIVHIKWYKGVNTSYDLLTEDKGYRISGVPVDSMIPEMMQLINFLESEVK